MKALACSVLCVVILLPQVALSYQKGAKPSRTDSAQTENVAIKNPSQIEVYADANVSRPFVIVGKADTWGTFWTHSKCKQVLIRDAAKKYGGDAIVNFTNTPSGMCEGIVIRWAREGEKGITAIDAKTSIPVLK